MHNPFVSVVIPVLNDAARLKLCLKALEKQMYPADAYEVIVVDNGSTDDTKAICMGYSATRYLFEPIRGLHKARNTGIGAAKGAVLAFTDADCIPEPSWIEKGAAALARSPNTGLIAGRIDIFYQDPANPTAVELFEKLTAFRQKEYIEKMHFAAPANVFTSKSVIEKVGHFDGTLKSGADVEWGDRVFKAGYAQIYADDAVVAHPARRTPGELIRKHRRVVGGLYDMRKRSPYPLKKFLVDLKDDWPQARDLRSAMSDERLHGMGQRSKVFFVMALVKCARSGEMIRLRCGGKSRW
jgi:glycosyltransferase involved in cell wall biosynthesis